MPLCVYYVEKEYYRELLAAVAWKTATRSFNHLFFLRLHLSSHFSLLRSSSIKWQMAWAALWSALPFASPSHAVHARQHAALIVRRGCPCSTFSDANGQWPLAGQGDNKIIRWGLEAEQHTKEGRWAHLPSAGMPWKWGAKDQRQWDQSERGSRVGPPASTFVSWIIYTEQANRWSVETS